MVKHKDCVIHPAPLTLCLHRFRRSFRRQILHRKSTFDSLHDYWDAVHARDRMAAIRAVLCGKCRGEFDNKNNNDLPTLTAIERDSTSVGETGDPQVRRLTEGTGSPHVLNAHDRSNLADSRRALREKLKALRLQDSAATNKQLQLQFGTPPLDLFGVAFLHVFGDFQDGSHAEGQTLSCQVGPSQQDNVTKLTRTWAQQMSACGHSVKCLIGDLSSVPVQEFDWHDALALLSSKYLRLVVHSPRRYRYDERKVRCTQRRRKSEDPNHAATGAVVEVATLFQVKGDDEW